MTLGQKTAFTVQMNPLQGQIKRKTVRMLEELGRGPAVERFLNKYGKDNLKRIYSIVLALYLRWLKSKGVNFTPDELVLDNLRCIYESAATDVQTKRRHTDWLDEFVNSYLVGIGRAQNTRTVSATIIQRFYRRNDSPLLGDFQVSNAVQQEPARPLKSSIDHSFRGSPTGTTTTTADARVRQDTQAVLPGGGCGPQGQVLGLRQRHLRDDADLTKSRLLFRVQRGALHQYSRAIANC